MEKKELTKKQLNKLAIIILDKKELTKILKEVIKEIAEKKGVIKK